MSTMMQTTDLRQVAADVVERALHAGATDAEAVVREGDEFSVGVRLGEVETLKESGSRALGVRVFLGQRAASVSTSDLSPQGVDSLVRSAVALARISSEDPFAGLPDADEFGQVPHDLELYHEDVLSLPAAERILYAKRAEAVAMAADTRIQNSDGSSFDAATGRIVLANSRGFHGEYRSSYCSIAVSPIAIGADGEMQRDYWYSSARTVRRLDAPEAVGAEAARRTLRRLDARRVPTQQVPVVFAPEVARSLVGSIFSAASGDAIYRGASFLAGLAGQQVASPAVTVVDDGALVGGFGSAPFDGEGLPRRRTDIIESGVLKNYLLNSYTARKLNLRSTGNAGRGLAGNPHVDAGNLYLEAGTHTPEEIIAGVQRGLYVTGLIGQGVNLVTGDYSRGASGIWIENGELAFPVQEITVAGNLREMLRNVAAIGNDLVFRGSVASPTLCIEGMTVAGE